MKKFIHSFLILSLVLTMFPANTLAQEEQEEAAQASETSLIQASTDEASVGETLGAETSTVEPSTTEATGPDSSQSPQEEVGEETTHETSEDMTGAGEEAEGEEESGQGVQAPLPKPVNGGIEPPLPPVDPVPTPGFTADPKSFLNSFQGKGDVSLFSGALSYQFPLWAPQGRLGMMPSMALSYSSSNSRYGSPVGYGWNLPTNAIYRVPRDGYDKVYEQDEYFGADVFGSSSQLMVYDADEGIYKPIHQGEGIDFMYDDQSNSWEMRDARGTTYTFGTGDSTRQNDPEDASRTYKWMLERVEDLNGNFMTLTYTEDQGAIYPESIRWTGHGNDEGLFEMQFVLEDRPAYSDYKTSFRVTHAKRVDQIDLYSYESGDPELKLTYQLDYNDVNSAISLLRSIETEAQGMALPGTYFEYFDGTENTEDKKLHALKEIETLYGAQYRYSYQQASAYRYNDGTASNWIPFTTHTVKSQSVQARPGDPEYITSYDYRDGHYYFDDLDAYRREYAGFGKVTVTDPEANTQVLYFHQSEFDPNNSANEALGEYEDHIGKKGRLYRQEHYSSGEVLVSEVIRRWDRDNSLTQKDSPEERGRIFLAQQVSVNHGQGESRAKGASYVSNDYGSPIETTDYGEVELLNATGEFDDVGEDRVDGDNDYTENTNQHLFSVLTQSIKRDIDDNLLGKTELSYDDLPWDQVEKGHWTDRQDWVSELETIEYSRSVNAMGSPTSMTNARGHQTSVSYDEFDLYVEQVTNAKGHQGSFVHDPFFGKPIETVDSNGHTQAQELDIFGRPYTRFTQNTEGDLAVSEAFHYEMPGDPVSITHTRFLGLDDVNKDPIELTSVTYLDGLGRALQSKQEAEGNQFVASSQRYNSLGQVEASTLPVFSDTIDFEEFDDNTPKTTVTYDSLGRALSQTTPVGTTSTTYSAWSQTVTDANGQNKDFEADARGNLTKVTEHLGNETFETTYGYNTSNQLVNITDAEGGLRTMTYDLFGRRLSQTLLHAANEQDPNEYTFTYDENSNLLTRTDAKGQVANYTYDELDRMTSEETGGSTFELNYDELDNDYTLGRLTSVMGENMRKWFTYDSMGRLTNESQKLETGTYETLFHYNGIGAELTRVTYPNELEVYYRYNNAGQLEQVPGYVDNFDYAPHAGLTQIDYTNGVSTTNTYEPAEAYRLVARQTAGGETFQDLAYEFDPVGNITQITESAQTNLAKIATYTYDDLDRLITANITGTPNPDVDLTYTYNSTGNILNKSNLGDFTYNDVHPQAATQAGGNAYAYDANGSLTSSPSFAHSYNARNQLILSESEDEAKTAYFYNEAGQRLYKVTKAGIVTYVNDLFENDMEVERAFVMAGNLKLATLDKNGTTFHHSDHLSGASVSTDGEGKLVEQMDYLPFGSSRVEKQEVDNDYLYTGQERDEETGLYYYGARYYLSDLGRFASVDPWFGNIRDPQTLNKYSYVMNNPLRYNDPTGRTASDTLATAWMIAAGTAMIDTPVPGPADVVGLVIGVAGTAVSAVQLAYEVTFNPSIQPLQESGPNVIVDTAPPAQDVGPLVFPVNPPAEAPMSVDPIPEVQQSPPYTLDPPNTFDYSQCGVTSSCANDSSKNEKHGDLGRTIEKSQEQIKILEAQLADATTRKEKKKIKQKMKNIKKDAKSKKKGEEHSRTPKR